MMTISNDNIHLQSAFAMNNDIMTLCYLPACISQSVVTFLIHAVCEVGRRPTCVLSMGYESTRWW